MSKHKNKTIDELRRELALTMTDYKKAVIKNDDKQAIKLYELKTELENEIETRM
jgi:hypothetical protein